MDRVAWQMMKISHASDPRWQKPGQKNIIMRTPTVWNGPVNQSDSEPPLLGGFDDSVNKLQDQEHQKEIKHGHSTV